MGVTKYRTARTDRSLNAYDLFVVTIAITVSGNVVSLSVTVSAYRSNEYTDNDDTI